LFGGPVAFIRKTAFKYTSISNLKMSCNGSTIKQTIFSKVVSKKAKKENY